ncbi:MAG: hypothetical protein E5W91_08170 [Mesorhizobium sp.]|uniref:hypothetical protein n=1 Tax=Mesorhizobium sp. TaxID=1871066 RepID=UPI001222386C|nr:hypothetical protein [Mesorhizobium sp.]TIS58443.1 MAG: hypothetical protein E5W91_08170 [Mesorhizobium sp.]
MADETPSAPDMRDLMATIGEVLLLWGFLETAMRERLYVLRNGDAGHSKMSLLVRWQHAEQSAALDDLHFQQLVEDIIAAAVVRNSLAHGLSSASVDSRGSEEPRVVCRDRDGIAVTYSLSALEKAKQQIHDVRIRVQNR